MRKAVLVLVVLALAGPLYAADGDVTLTAVDNGYGTCTIGYSVGPGDATPVGIALNVDVDGGEPAITSVTGIDSFFDVFVDYAYDMGLTYVYKGSSANSPVAKQAAAGETTLAADGMAFCISQCGLDDTGSESAPESGVIAIISSGVNTASSGKISLNALRGGIVSENGAMNVLGLDGNGELAFNIHSACSYNGPDQADWATLLEPQSWCDPKQCHGDADGVSQDLGWGQFAPVGVGDILKFIPAYRELLGSAKEDVDCDFDHVAQDLGWGQYTRVGSGDVTVLVTYYRELEADVPGDCQTANPVEP